MTRLTIAVLIPTFNRARFLPQTLDSVLTQSRPPDQIIVVDDGSTDITSDVVNSYLDRIQYLKKANGGKSSALNFALAHVKCDLVAIVDDDDVLLPGALERQAKAFDADPGIDMTHGPVLLATGEANSELIPTGMLHFPNLSPDGFFASVLLGFRGHLGAMLVRRRCYDAVGGFDETLVRSQDFDMMLKLARCCKVAFVGEPVYCLRLHEGERGGLRDPHRVADRASRWLQYNQIIFHRVWRDVSLSEYLPPSALVGMSAATRERRLLIRRLTVMARRALKDEVLSDLRAIMHRANFGAQLSRSERDDCANAFSMPYPAAELCQDANFIRSLRAPCRGPLGTALRYEFARGLYYAVREIRRDHDPLPAGRIARAGAVLLGWGGFAALVKSKSLARRLP